MGLYFAELFGGDEGRGVKSFYAFFNIFVYVFWCFILFMSTFYFLLLASLCYHFFCQTFVGHVIYFFIFSYLLCSFCRCCLCLVVFILFYNSISFYFPLLLVIIFQPDFFGHVIYFYILFI